MDLKTKAKIDALLKELRAWEPGVTPKLSILELANLFELDPLIIERVAQSEGIRFDDTPPPLTDPNADTQPRAVRPSVYWSERLNRYVGPEDEEWSFEESEK